MKKRRKLVLEDLSEDEESLNENEEDSGDEYVPGKQLNSLNENYLFILNFVFLKLFVDKKVLNKSESESEESPAPSDDDSFIDDGSDEEISPNKVFILYCYVNDNHHLICFVYFQIQNKIGRKSKSVKANGQNTSTKSNKSFTPNADKSINKVILHFLNILLLCN